jgi:sulfate permease, SulP family
VLVAAGLAIMYLLPRVTTAIPAPLVAIVLLTIFTVTVGVGVPTVGDEGELPSTLPILGIPAVPLSLEMLQIIAPYALTLAAVGLLESLMTAKLVDDITETPSDKDRESRGQGISNVVTGLFGGMAGCAMIGQTMINVRVSRARTRISTFASGAFLLILVVGLGSVVAVIPMAALVAVMLLVAASTFDWHSIAPATLKRMPRGETTVMVVTVAGTVATHNLAIGVGAGVLTAMAIFARRVAHLVEVERIVDPEGTTAIYSVTGELFFASDQELIDSFHYPEDPPKVLIDFSRAHLWDASAIAALDAIETHYRAHDIEVEISGLNQRSEALHADLSGNLAPAH